MNKRRKRILLIISAAVCLAILLFTVKFISDGSVRRQLPDYPDSGTIPKSLKKQILGAGRRAFINPSSNNLGKLGMVYYSGTYNEKAAECFQLAVNKNSEDWRWSYYLGCLNLEQSELKASIENFDDVIKKTPKNYLALLYTGEASQNLGLTSDAENIFRIIASQKDNSIPENNSKGENYFPIKTYAKFFLARIYINSNRLDSAEIILKEIIENQMTFGPAYRLLGNVYTLKGNSSLGNKYTIRAGDLADYTPPQDKLMEKIALMSRSEAYLLTKIDDAIYNKNFNLALQLCDQAMKYIPENKFLISRAILRYLAAGNDEKAFVYMDKHFKSFLDDFDELIKMAGLIFEKGYKTQAMTYFGQAKKLQPDNSRLALWLSSRGMQNEAVILLNEQITRNPKNADILVDAVKLILRMGKREMAISYLSKLKQLSPSNPEGLKLTGAIAEEEGKFPQALSIYEEAFRNDPKDLDIIKYLAEIYIRKEMWHKAILHLRQALDSYPNMPFLLEGLGNLLITCPDTGLINVNEGREYSERAYINYKSNLPVIISAGRNLAKAYTILGDKQKAAWYLNQSNSQAKEENFPRGFLQ